VCLNYFMLVCLFVYLFVYVFVCFYKIADDVGDGDPPAVVPEILFLSKVQLETILISKQT